MRYLIGIGHYYSGDDAIGSRVVEEVAARGLEEEFRAINLSANSLNLISYLVPETQAILIVDSARMGLQPGDVRFFAPEQVETAKNLPGISTHEGDVLKVIELARAMTCVVPKLRFMGIEPETVESGAGLSRALLQKLDAYVAAAVNELKRM
jgi:hydrogenase maturation protease